MIQNRFWLSTHYKPDPVPDVGDAQLKKGIDS